jgi:hypothetical protein
MICPDGSAVREPTAQFGLGRFARAFDDGHGNSGITELSLGYVTDDDVRLGGYIAFGGLTIYNIDAAGDRVEANNFLGIGHFGSATSCKFSAAQK